MVTAVRAICIAILLSVFPFRVRAEEFINAIHAYLKQRIEAKKINGCIVVVHPRVILTNLTWISSGGFQFTFETIAGISYTVQWSSTVTNWFLLKVLR